MDRILILGAGQFGRRAAIVLQQSGRDVTIVDQDSKALEQVEGQAEVIEEEAIIFMQANLKQYHWIVPAIPLHVALLWFLAELEKSGQKYERIAVPQWIKVPNPFWHKGTLYASLANHLCPENCPEPDGFCTVTNEARPKPLYRILSDLEVSNFTVDVLQSHQLAPGVGGLLTTDLQQLKDNAWRAGQQRILATSCGCHSVIDAFRVYN